MWACSCCFTGQYPAHELEFARPAELVADSRSSTFTESASQNRVYDQPLELLRVLRCRRVERSGRRCRRESIPRAHRLGKRIRLLVRPGFEQHQAEGVCREGRANASMPAERSRAFFVGEHAERCHAILGLKPAQNARKFGISGPAGQCGISSLRPRALRRSKQIDGSLLDAVIGEMPDDDITRTNSPRSTSGFPISSRAFRGVDAEPAK